MQCADLAWNRCSAMVFQASSDGMEACVASGTHSQCRRVQRVLEAESSPVRRPTQFAAGELLLTPGTGQGSITTSWPRMR
jgi:hypothetical protein